MFSITKKYVQKCVIAAAAGVVSLSGTAFAGLGVASDFNVFVLNDMVAQNSDTEGRLAVGGNATLTNYGVGDKLSNSNGTRDDLIVEGNLSYTNGQVFFGNAVHGGTLTGSVSTPNGTTRQESGVIDFGAAQTQLTNLSQSYSGLTSNGTYQSNFGVTLTGTDANLNIFNVSAAQLEAANGFGLTMNVPAGSTALVNVSGTSINLQNFSFFNFDATRTLFNYYEASSVDVQMQSLAPHGSILAPTADVSFFNGQLLGTLVASSLEATGEFHHVPFAGVIPIPSPGAAALLGLAGLVRKRRRRRTIC